MIYDGTDPTITYKEKGILYPSLIFFTLVVTFQNCLLFYFLIAAIVDSYTRVSEAIKNQVYLMRAIVLHEYEFLFNRKKIFQKTKYIIKAEKEMINGDSKASWLGLANSITQSLKGTLATE